MSGEGGKITLNNNTIVNNKPKGSGGGLATIYGSSITGVNNIIFFNENSQCSGTNITLTYTACSDNLNGIGNITSDPQFVNAAIDDYNLKQGSPCIDTGDPNSPQDPDKTQADMGALYFNQGTGIADKNPLIGSFKSNMYQTGFNYINRKVSINYELLCATDVEMVIVDVSGKIIRTLVDSRKFSGTHKVNWNGLNNDGAKVAPGIYFCRFSTGNYQSVLRLLMVK